MMGSMDGINEVLCGFGRSFVMEQKFMQKVLQERPKYQGWNKDGKCFTPWGIIDEECPKQKEAYHWNIN
jgi:hypothetical protein